MVRAFLFLAACVSSTAFAQHSSDSPCNAGFNSLLALINRPSNLDSACTVPSRNLVLETGYSAIKLRPNGDQNNAPQPELRYGLADFFEVYISPSNYISQSVYPRAGFSAIFIGVKHELASSPHWIASVEGTILPSSGSAKLGSLRTGGEFNGIFSYVFTPELAVNASLGVSSQSNSTEDQGLSYTSFNPDFLLSWTQNRVSLYAEVFGQSKTAPHQGSGYNFDFGLIYLLRQHITLDLSFGHRLSGSLGAYNQYLSLGACLQFT